MVKWCLALVMLFLANGWAHAQVVTIDSGTTLVYRVEDYGTKYAYSVTVAHKEPFELHWKTDSKPSYKGQSMHYDSAYDYATRLLIRPNQQSMEYVEEDAIRLAAPYNMCYDIHDSSAPILYYGIDGAEAALEKYTEKTKVKTVGYNGGQAKFLSANYRDKNLGIKIGFMPVGARFWVYYYKDENLIIQLQEIKNPAL